MLTGIDLRRYRRALHLGQIEFAKQLGIAQSTLSEIEADIIPISQDHIDRFIEAFSSPQFSPSFSQYLDELKRGAGHAQTALTTTAAHHAILPVWRWEVDFDLSRRPAPELEVDLIAVRGLSESSIALQMPGKSKLWREGELVVFESCRREDVQDGEICLAQVKVPRSKSSQTFIGLVHVTTLKRGRVVKLEPVTPPGPTVTAERESLLAILRPVYRAQRLKS